jgi:hypothetical protein
MAANVAMIYREFRQEKSAPNMLELFGLMAQLAQMTKAVSPAINQSH